MKAEQKIISNTPVVSIKIHLESENDAATYTMATANALLKSIGYVIRNPHTVVVIHDIDQQRIIEQALINYMEGISDGLISVPFIHEKEGI